MSANGVVTKAVIIAAGSGKRLQTSIRKTPKPLTKVLGVPLLKRVILTSRQAGLTEFHVVVGFHAHEVIQAVESDADLSGLIRRGDLSIHWIYNPEWKKSNGVSVLKAAESLYGPSAHRPWSGAEGTADSVRGPFVLMMSDHLFPQDTLAKLVQTPLGEDEVILAVDRKVSDIYDLDDAMKVQTQGELITGIGKDLQSFDAIDTGMFLCSNRLFEHLKAHYAEKRDCSLADGVRAMAEVGKLRLFDVGPAWWQDVDTPGSLRHAQRLLLNATQKTTDGVFSRYLNRPVSHLVSRWLVWTRVSPNQVTFANFSLALLAAYLVSYKSTVPFLMGAVLFQLTSVLDGVDGEVAKLKFKQSKRGEWLDTITDNLSYLAFFVGITVGAFRRTPEDSVLWLGGAALLGGLVSLALIYRHVHRQGRGTLVVLGTDLEKVIEECHWFVRAVWHLRFAVKRDCFAILFLCFAVAGKPMWILWTGAVATNVMWMVVLLSRAQLWQMTPSAAMHRAEK
ncbi:MAG: NTP transferase domain-containing protein [Nitrospirae bacterium]|nr:NTP transferase domain-containing protein [Nitrospirota bacterium]